MYSFLWMIWILYVRCVDDFVLIIFEKEFMIPKIIHLCWFSEESFPVEIKICLASWKRILPDYTIRLWTYADALAIGCDYVSEALSVKNGLLQQMLSVFMQSIKKAEFTWTVICFLKTF